MIEDAAQRSQTPQAPVRVLVALGINPNSQRLLLTAARLAEGLQGQLFAIHIEPPGHVTTLYEANRTRYLNKARELGAHVEIVKGEDVATTLVNYAETHNMTHLVLGQSDVSRWREITRGSVINRILRMILSRQLGVDLYIVTVSSRF
ncbi:MAG TPA: universal stress protein [Herpetosiphonaceae bacterium]